jgi:hypothetical protein
MDELALGTTGLSYILGGPEYSSFIPLTWHDKTASPVLMLKPLPRGKYSVAKS